jgi:hypothetical protein
MRMNEGRCLCGAVRYVVDGPITNVVHCHCSMCRKHHGAAFVTWAVAPASGFRITAGADTVARYESSPGLHRSFCRACGSVTPERTPDGGHVVIPAGNLDGELPAPELRMFVASRASWHTIADDLPRHDGWPPEFNMPEAQRPPVPTRSDGRLPGSCLCGAVTYAVAGPPLRFMYCHCSRCRRARGAAHAANLFYALPQFEWLGGSELIVDFPLPEAQRFGVAFCGRCGSHVPRVSTARNVAVVPAGTLDGDPGLRAEAHIFVDSRAQWDALADDGIPRFPALPPS